MPGPRRDPKRFPVPYSSPTRRPISPYVLDYRRDRTSCCAVRAAAIFLSRACLQIHNGGPAGARASRFSKLRPEPGAIQATRREIAGCRSAQHLSPGSGADGRPRRVLARRPAGGGNHRPPSDRDHKDRRSRRQHGQALRRASFSTAINRPWPPRNFAPRRVSPKAAKPHFPLSSPCRGCRTPFWRKKSVTTPPT